MAGLNFHTILHTIEIVGVCVLVYFGMHILNASRRLERQATENEQIKKKVEQIELNNLNQRKYDDSVEVRRNQRIDSVLDNGTAAIKKMQVVDKKITDLQKVFKDNHVDLPDPDK